MISSRPRPDDRPAAAQPRRGLLGLVFVLPVTALLAAGAGGPARTLEVLGPPVTFTLPLVAMIAFWWDDWPGTLLRGAWSGLADTALVAAGGAGLTLLGRTLTGTASVPLAAGIFTLLLQVTLVGEGWPVRGRGTRWPGAAAVALCWVVGWALYAGLVGTGAVPAEDYGAWFAVLGAWQLVWFVALRGRPFARIRRRGVRLVTAHAAVLACAAATSGLLPPDRLAPVAGAVIASVLVVAMLFEAWPATRLDPLPGRGLVLVLVALLTTALSWALPRVARWAAVPDRLVTGWATHTTLNALSLAVILHVAVWRRWPASAP
ncbi:hypothetical protein [Amycolatopsis australiensis]|uniref:YndJ-like protein n=1 Tax=Amycolatopsis australiensis TaxID=546364 RepID=A0A1K1SLE0_9PSEU|nr:hypothetical protein [Amycolatopsis australiensis]SFW85145.1 hypothetical protein SAMN04489730_6054 [Amycolatopsis australiensis]